MLNEVKHLAIAREILPLRLRSGLKAICAQNDIVHHLTCDRVVVRFNGYIRIISPNPPHVQVNFVKFGYTVMPLLGVLVPLWQIIKCFL
jgi:hypothetical protein